MNKQTKENSTIRKDILDTLDKIYPDNMIGMWNGVEVSYLEEIYENLQENLSGIESAAIEYERDWTGDELECDCACCEECAEYEEDDEDSEEEDNTEEDETEEDEDSLLVEDSDMEEDSDENILASSYHLFFLALQGEQFEYECQAEDFDDEGNKISLNGSGVIGCCVAVSLLAPYAIVSPANMEIYDDDSYTFPDIDLQYAGLNKNIKQLEDYIETNFTSLMKKEEIQSLNELMNQVTSVLESHGISILSEEDANKPVPWLKPSEDVFIDVPDDDTITLKEALFFRGTF